jgi:uncharacterized membrane protein YbhN (UPF0104 family)
MNKATLSQILKRAVPIIFYILLIVFLYFYLRSIDFSRIKDIDFNWWYLAVATVFALLFRYFGAYIWTVILRSLGAEDIRFSKTLIYVYAKSWLGRYIPGTAPWILGKIYFAARQGISKKKLAVSSLLEAALQIVVQILVALGLIAFDTRLDVVAPEIKVGFIILAILCLVILIPPVFNLFISSAYKLIKKKVLEPGHLASSKTILKGFTLYVIGSLLAGLSLFFIAKTVYPALPYNQLSFVIGVSTLASAVSMLAIFAPGGIGVRESIQLVLLSIIMPTEFALVVTIATRLWSVVIDLMFFTLAKAATARSCNKFNNSNPTKAQKLKD